MHTEAEGTGPVAGRVALGPSPILGTCPRGEQVSGGATHRHEGGNKGVGAEAKVSRLEFLREKLRACRERQLPVGASQGEWQGQQKQGQQGSAEPLQRRPGGEQGGRCQQVGQKLLQQELVGQEATTLVDLFFCFNNLFSQHAYSPLHSLCYRLGKRCSNSSHVWLALSMLSTRGPNGVALRDSVLRSVQAFYSDPGEKQAEIWLTQRARAAYNEPVTGLVCLALAVLAALNCLMGVAWSLKPIAPEAFYPLSVAQEQTLSHVLASASDILSIPVVPFNLKEEQNIKAIGYRMAARWCQCEGTSLPIKFSLLGRVKVKRPFVIFCSM